MRLHHSGQAKTLSGDATYFSKHEELRGANLSLAERCNFVRNGLRTSARTAESLIDEALKYWPLGSAPVASESASEHWRKVAKLQSARAQVEPPSSKQLGDLGENLVRDLLISRGYEATLLPKNYPTYDVRVLGQKEFLVSVKVARDRQHLRLGSRRSVARLEAGNFLFALLPRDGDRVVDLDTGAYKLLILPAGEVRDHALRVHDEYWSSRGVDDGYSVMVKAYDQQHEDLWVRWSACADAWQQLPDALPARGD